jgi:transcription initiation protein SPT3
MLAEPSIPSFGAFMEGNPNDEVIDVLGFLSYEMVRTLCERGFEAQAAATALTIRNPRTPAKRHRPQSRSPSPVPSKPAKRVPSIEEPTGLFSAPPAVEVVLPARGEAQEEQVPKKPLLVRDIDHAFEATQNRAAKRMKSLRCFRGGPVKTRVALL